MNLLMSLGCATVGTLCLTCAVVTGDWTSPVAAGGVAAYLSAAGWFLSALDDERRLQREHRDREEG